MIVENKKIVKATEDELFDYYLKRGFDDLFPFDFFLKRCIDNGTMVVDVEEASEND